MWCQTVQELRQKRSRPGIESLCRLFGHSRQAWYKNVQFLYKKASEDEIMLEMVHRIRKDMPRMGGRKLIHLIKEKSEGQIAVGRDGFYNLLRRNGLLVRRRRNRVVTTNSFHWLRKYPNLIRDLKATRPNQIWVSDITYIKTDEGFLYLFLLTDLYSRKIIGWKLADNMGSENAVMALEQAIANANGLVRGTIHHSDRGMQYCSGDYVKILQGNQMRISMTENGDPYENAVAERVNGILKDEWLYEMQLKNQKHSLEILNQIIALYNENRPHLSLNYQTPDMVYNNHQTNTPITPLKCKPHNELKNVLVNLCQD
ncbi:MAG: IS3 family transposase [Bacteroidales bacterium]